MDQFQLPGKLPTSTYVRLGIFFVLLLGFVSAIYNLVTMITSPRVPAVVTERATSVKEITRGDVTKRQVIFTFDGGSGAQSAQSILKTLAAHHVRGTFFLTGRFIEANPEIVKQIAEAGHEIFNHTYDHPHLTDVSDEDIAKELNSMEDMLMNTTGHKSGPFFRPPYGDRDGRVLNQAFKDGYQSVYWTVDAGDWEESEGMTAVEVEDKILNSLAPGNIYLMHIGDTITGNILDGVFTKIENQGYRIVSLTQGL